MKTLLCAEEIRDLQLHGLEVEIGSGNGHFLAAYAKSHRDRHIVGIEKKRPRAAKALSKVNARGLENADIVRGRAEDVLDLLPPGSVHAFHIYFPDPWPKNRHRRRRFVRREAVDRIFDLLAPGGHVYFATDMRDYHLQARVLFALHGRYLPGPSAPQECFLSVFSDRFTRMGRPIHFASWSKVNSDDMTQQQQHQEKVHTDVRDNQRA